MPIKKVTKKDWLWIGVTFFSKGGVKALNVEKMAKQLKCTKGSFYWYFKSREDYIRQLVDLWASEGTEAFIDNTKASPTAQAKLKQLIMAVFKDRRALDFEFHLRYFGQKNTDVKHLIEKTERRRVRFMAGLLKEAKVGNPDMKAEIIYYYYLGWYEHNKHSQPTKKIMIKVLEKISLISGLDLLQDSFE